jgi:phosphoribosyl 1,2-cyclic phosphodiesterase
MDHTLKFAVLSSGSEAGNAFVVHTERTRLLIDCGITRPHIFSRLRVLGLEASEIDAVLITHDHGDHIHGLRGFLNAYRPPLYYSAGTVDREARDFARGWFDLHEFTPGAMFDIGDITVTPYSVDHDAINPVAYRFSAGNRLTGGIVVATDLGSVGDDLEDAIDTADLAFLESNHDTDMLFAGPLPAGRKLRVSQTHLSNDTAFELVKRSTCRQFILGHISSTNNNLDLLRLRAHNTRKTVIVAPPGCLASLEDRPPLPAAHTHTTISVFIH